MNHKKRDRRRNAMKAAMDKYRKRNHDEHRNNRREATKLMLLPWDYKE